MILKRRCTIKGLILALAISICFTSSVFAQAAGSAKKSPAAPAARQPAAAQPQGQQQITLKTIFAYEKELGLTEKQVASLKDILSKFQDFVNAKRTEIVDRRTQLNDMIVKKADMKAIRNLLEQISRLQVDISYTDIETARKVEGVLTSSQLAKWKGIQDQARKEAEAAIRKAREEEQARANQ